MQTAIALNSAQLQPFPLDRIVDNSTTDFDLFLEVGGHVVLYGAEDYKWMRSELDSLLRHGYTQFLIRSEDANRAKMYQQVTSLPLIEKNLIPRERIVSIEQVGAAFIKCMYEGEITPACVAKARSIGEALVNCVAEDVACIQALSGLGNYDYYTYYHSIRVATYTVAIAIQMGLKDEAMLRDLALGGIFHDIGKKDVPIEILNKIGALTPSEWDMMRAHPEKGLTSISETILSHVPREIISHHHEKLDGSGYPHGLDKSALLQEVQIATMADVFDALTSTRSYQQKRSRFEALDFIKHKFLGSKVSIDAFKALIACLIEKN